MLSKATPQCCVFVSWHFTAKNMMAGYFLLQPLWLLMDQSADVGYLKLPMELHAKVISLLEIGHIVSKPMVLESVLFLG